MKALLKFSYHKITLPSKIVTSNFSDYIGFLHGSVIQQTLTIFTCVAHFITQCLPIIKKITHTYLKIDTILLSVFFFFFARRGGQVIFLLCFEQNHNYEHSFAFLLFSVSCFLSARFRDDVRARTQAQAYRWITGGNSYLLWVGLIKQSIFITRPLKDD